MTSTNESYRSIAMRRGGKAPDEVSVVRTGPDPQAMKPGAPVPSERRGRDHLVAYLGVMGPQDGVDVVLAAAEPHRAHARPDRHLVHADGWR